MKTVPNYPGGLFCVAFFAVTCGLRAYAEGRDPLIWGLVGGAITLVGVVGVWARGSIGEDGE